MEDKQTTTDKNNSDEIDLGRLFQMIGNGFSKIFTVFLRVFLYFKKNFVVIAGIGIFGLAIGFGLDKIFVSLKKIEVIVKPNFGSKDYLYGAVSELKSKIEANDTLFFSNLGIDLEAVPKFEIKIEPSHLGLKSSLEENLKFGKSLGDLKDNSIINQIIKDEILSSSYNNPTISFYFSEGGYGRDVAQKIVEYLNTSTYFTEVKEIFLDNARQKIEKNKALIKQIDLLITNYTIALGTKVKQSIGDGMVLLGGEQGLNIPALFNLKNTLLQSIASSKLVLKEQENVINILNFGQTQEIEKMFFKNRKTLIPTVLIGFFFLWSLLKYLNKKALQLS